MNLSKGTNKEMKEKASSEYRVSMEEKCLNQVTRNPNPDRVNPFDEIST